MSQVLIAYHTGTGGTKLVSEVLKEMLSTQHQVVLDDVTDASSPPDCRNFDFLVFGYPTFYLLPTESIKAYVDSLPQFEVPKPAFVFTTAAMGKWYTGFTQFLQRQIFNKFQDYRYQFRVFEGRCNNCGLCIARCYRQAWQTAAGQLIHNGENCELCLRCVHHCPQLAIGWNEVMKDRPRLTPQLYRRLKQEMVERLK